MINDASDVFSRSDDVSPESRLTAFILTVQENVNCSNNSRDIN